MTRRPIVYIAAPLFNEGERTLNQAIKNALIDYVDVYLPQVDGALLADKIKEGIDPQAASQAIFEADCEALKRCDALIIVMHGRSIDEGAAFELGVAWSLGKTCVGFKDDPRQLLATGDNPMIVHAVDRVMKDLDQVREWGKSLAQPRAPAK